MKVIMQSIIEISNNVSFSAESENGTRYQFLVSREALDDAVGYRGELGESISRYEVFINHMDKILDVAEHLVSAGVRSEPIVITTELLNR